MTQKSTLVLLRHMSPSESLQKYVIQKLNCSLFKFYKMFQFKVHKCLPIRNRGLERFLLYYYWKNTCSTNICFFFMFIQFIFRNFFYIISKEFDIVYMCYVFPTQTTRSEFDDSQFQVRRRYNDFLWLRQKLEESYPTHLVPVSKWMMFTDMYRLHCWYWTKCG